MISKRVAGFVPALYRFGFTNSWQWPILVRFGPAEVDLSQGYGLCGGMTFTMRDVFESNRTPPKGGMPEIGSPLYAFLLQRLHDSLPLDVVARNFALSDPTLPDHDTGTVFHTRRGRAAKMILEEWPKVRADIDAGRLSMLGLIRVKSFAALDIANNNHQVIAHGYDLDGDSLVLRIWDPNPTWPECRLELSLANPGSTTAVTYVNERRTVQSDGTTTVVDVPGPTTWMFFRQEYSSRDASSVAGPVARDAVVLGQTAPARLETGQAHPVSVDVLNTGAHAWTQGLGYALGSRAAGVDWGAGDVAIPHDTAAGGSVRFDFQVRAPSAPGEYAWQWGMRQVGVRDFGAPSGQVRVAVADPATFVAQSVPSQVVVGGRHQVSVTMRNTSDQQWTPHGPRPHALGSQAPQDNLTWGLNRVPLPAPVDPGEEVTFVFEVTAPGQPGTHSFQWRMVHERVRWFGQPTPVVAVGVSPPRMSVRIEPHPVSLGRRRTYVVSASDARTGAPVSGEVRIDNHRSTPSRFPTNSPFPFRFETRVVEAPRPGRPPELTYPSLTVAAAGYLPEVVDLGV